jgi:hypothetical protein
MSRWTRAWPWALPASATTARHFRQIAGTCLQAQAAAADPRKVQQLLDHPRHAQGAGFQVLQGLLRTGIVLWKLQRQLVGTQQDRRQRRAQVVGEHGRHRLVELERTFQRLVARLQQLALLVELDEDVDLAQDHLRRHRLVQEIDRTGFVALEHAPGHPARRSGR